MEELAKYWLDNSKVETNKFVHFKIDKENNLWWNRKWYSNENEQWEILIDNKRLTESDWLSDMAQDLGSIYGEFVRAYFTLLEIIGVKEINTRIYGFECSNRFEVKS